MEKGKYSMRPIGWGVAYQKEWKGVTSALQIRGRHSPRMDTHLELPAAAVVSMPRHRSSDEAIREGSSYDGERYEAVSHLAWPVPRATPLVWAVISACLSVQEQAQLSAFLPPECTVRALAGLTNGCVICCQFGFVSRSCQD